MADFLLHQRIGNHADGRAAVRQHAVRHDAHQPDLATAVNQRKALLGHGGAQHARRLGIFRAEAGAGPAIHANRFHCLSFFAAAAASASALETAYSRAS
ncbi:hypothetical protein D3C87_1562120 [compost metagenome]